MPSSTATDQSQAAPAGPSRWTEVRGWLGTAVRLLLAGTWLWAGLGKIGDPAASVRAVRAYRLLPEWLAKSVGYGLPYLEIGLALLLLAGLAARLAAVAAVVLLLVFLAGVVSAAARGLQIDCGCFGGGGSLGQGRATRYTLEILRDIGLLIPAAYLAVWPRSRYGLDDAVRNTVPGPDVARVGPRRTKAAQQRLAELAVQRRQQAGRRVRVASAVCGLALVAVTGTGIAIQSARVGTPAGPTPQAVSVQDGVTVGKSTAKVTVDLYEDMQCPICRQFESTASSMLKQYTDAGTVKVHYYVMSFLDSSSSTQYSSRAANAAYCAADAGVFAAYHDLLFQNQPAEGTAGLPNDTLISLGRQAGATSDTFAQCVNTKKYSDFVTRLTDRASQDGVSGTPTLLVNNTQVPNPTADKLRTAIVAALG